MAATAAAAALGGAQTSQIKLVAKLLAERFSRLPSYGQNMVIMSGLSMSLYAINKATQTRPEKPEPKSGDSVHLAKGDPTAKGKKRVALDAKFYEQFKFLLKIVLPSWKSKEAGILLLHTAFLVVRTFISIYVAKLDGRIVKALVDRDGRGFLYQLGVWLGVALPATYVNSMIRYLESKLSIAFRTRMVEYSLDQYCKNETYYRVGNLDGRIANADQCLTDDVAKFCNFLAHLYSQISKPILDIVLIAQQIFATATSGSSTGSSSGVLPLALSAVVVYLTARILKLVQPPFGRLAAEQQQYEGDLRYVHSRLIIHSEEIAFLGGAPIEKNLLHRAYVALVKHMNTIFKIRIPYGVAEGFFMKYVWSACGMLMIAIPAFFFEKGTEGSNKASSDTISSRTSSYVTSRQLLVSAADAIERVMLAFKEVNELAGYTHNVHEMLSVFSDVQRGEYHKGMVKADEDGMLKKDIRKQRGVVKQGEVIKFVDVPIVSPTGDILVENMNFEIKPGMHLLITGPNGCGKSSMFRILGSIWPLYGGEVIKPDASQIFYIPQRPYLCIGTFRDQIIYPDTVEDMKRKGVTDQNLEDILNWVVLQHVLKREGGWDSRNDWQDVLSGGEKQKVGMARLFYHKPKYAILDESSSAVAIDSESKMYQHAIDIGTTLLTVTHRPTLWKYHNYLLQFDGQGGYNFSELNASVRMSLKDEKSKLEQQLAGIPKMQERLQELCILLGEESVVLRDTFKAAESPRGPLKEEEAPSQAE